LWQAACREGRVLTGFDALIVAVPAPQAAPLVRAWPALAAHAASVTMRPCWAVMAAFAARVPTAFDGAFVSASPLAWIARDRSKPRRGFAETWVLHASTTWSEAHLADPPDAVAAFLVNAFADLVRGPLPVPALVAAHRWRYAVADPPLAAGPLADADARLVVTGDWCLGKRIEDAFLAGLAAVARLS
jgi:predicted NAD/FAD-dependent oxidoreductase